VASGGLAVVDVSAIAPLRGLPVSEAANLRGLAVTKVVGKPGLPVVYTTIGAGAAPSMFNPATAISTTLSNGNLTATHADTVVNTGARGVTALNTGKYYFEFRVDVAPNSSDKLGLIKPADSYGIAYASVAMSSNINVAGSFMGNLGGAFVATNFCGIAVDFDAGMIWFRKNALLWNNSGAANPATGAGGFAFAAGTALMPAVFFSSTAGTQYTINFGATAYANAAPAGFGNWVG